MTKKIGILTSGGDCAGLNAVLRAVTLRAIQGYGWEVYGIQQGTWGEVFNACADTHPSKREFYTRAAQLAGMPPPAFADDGEASFKIVDNRKLKRVLGYALHHPDLMALRFDETDSSARMENSA